MRRELKIFLLWLPVLGAIRTALAFPHRDISWSGALDAGVQLLLMIMAVFVAVQSRGKQRAGMIVLAVYFGYAAPLFVSSFLGVSLLSDNPYAQAYSHLYLNKIGLTLVCLVTAAWYCAAFLMPRARTATQTLVSLAAGAALTAALFGGYAMSPSSIGAEPEYADMRAVSDARETLIDAGRPATDREVGMELMRTRWQGIPAAEAEARTARLSAYLDDGGTTLYWKPVESKMAAGNLVFLALIALGLTAAHFRAPAHGAYMDKLLIGIGVIHAFEFFHYSIWTQVVAFDRYLDLKEISHYFSILCLLGMVVVMQYRLRFVAGGAGRFYERAIADRPRSTTRFIDEIDSLILKTFFMKSTKRSLGTLDIEQEKGRDHET